MPLFECVFVKLAVSIPLRCGNLKITCGVLLMLNGLMMLVLENVYCECMCVCLLSVLVFVMHVLGKPHSIFTVGSECIATVHICSCSCAPQLCKCVIIFVLHFNHK